MALDSGNPCRNDEGVFERLLSRKLITTHQALPSFPPLAPLPIIPGRMAGNRLSVMAAAGECFRTTG